MMCYHNQVNTAACAELFHHSLFKTIRFPKGRLFEDVCTSYLLFEQCEKIICEFLLKYWYVIRDGSM